MKLMEIYGNSNEQKKLTVAKIYNERPTDLPAVAVCLLQSLPFPDNSPILSGVFNYAVCVATDRVLVNPDEVKWSWVQFGSEEKEIIGHAMVDFGCDASKWYWCVGY